MAQNSKIEWCAHTCNLIWGCAKVSTGCQNCYAETLSNRWGNNVWGNDAPRRAIKSVWKDFDKYQKAAKEAGEIHSVFVGSMMDIFEKPMPLIDAKGNKLEGNSGDLRSRYFREVIPTTPNLLHLLLTKRPSNINKYIPKAWKINAPKNVMFGTSPANQKTADTLIPQLLKVKGKRFLSVEPQLDIVDLRKWLRGGGISWVICGGESGHSKRPFDCDWARLLRDHCKEFKTSFFMKQIDKVQPIPPDLQIRQFPTTYTIADLNGKVLHA